MKRGKTTEASLNLNKVAKADKRVFDEIGTFVATDGVVLPVAAGGPGGACCGGKGNGTTVNNKCTAVPASFVDGAGWSQLEFSVDEASQYQYSYKGNASTPNAFAIGDVDCDTVMATYTMQITKTGAGNPKAELLPPATGTY
jgi:hypothetical protein